MRNYEGNVGSYTYKAKETKTLGQKLMYFDVEVSNPNTKGDDIKSFRFEYCHLTEIGMDDYQITWGMKLKMLELAKRVWGD